MMQVMAEAEITDAELLAAFNQGDAKALEVLVGRYRQPLFSWLLGMTGNRADADDLFQEVWLRVIKNAKRFKNVSFKAWMWKIAKNLLIDFRRKRRPETSLDAVADADEVPLVDRLTAPDMDPARQAEIDDMTKRVMRAVETLPDMQREVFLMRTQGELTFSEIAAALGIPLNTALGRMHDAMNKLKKIMAEEDDYGTDQKPA
jgi:RNA polymerase sigma-70 factor (ECF subfamily)